MIRPEFEDAFHLIATSVFELGHKPIRAWHLLRRDGWIPQSIEEAELIAGFCGYSSGWAWHLYKQAIGEESRHPSLWGADDRDEKRTAEARSKGQRVRNKAAQARSYQRHPALPAEAVLLGLETWPVPIDVLKRAYRLAARRTHPDVGGDAVIFRAVTDAYQTLLERVG